VLMRMAREKLIPALFEKTSDRHGTPVAAVVLSTCVVFLPTAIMAIRGVSGSDLYDLMGSLAVFGFLTAYALVALALPFARRARGQHSHFVAAVSVAAVLVVVMIAVFDLRSTADAAHARLPYVYLLYIAAVLAWYAARRKHVATVNA
jgi:amino acid transporter